MGDNHPVEDLNIIPYFFGLVAPVGLWDQFPNLEKMVGWGVCLIIKVNLVDERGFNRKIKLSIYITIYLGLNQYLCNLDK